MKTPYYLLSLFSLGAWLCYSAAAHADPKPAALTPKAMSEAPADLQKALWGNKLKKHVVLKESKFTRAGDLYAAKLIGTKPKSGELLDYLFAVVVDDTWYTVDVFTTTQDSATTGNRYDGDFTVVSLTRSEESPPIFSLRYRVSGSFSSARDNYILTYYSEYLVVCGVVDESSTPGCTGSIPVAGGDETKPIYSEKPTSRTPSKGSWKVDIKLSGSILELKKLELNGSSETERDALDFLGSHGLIFP